MSDTDAQLDPAAFVKNSQLLTDLFGYWPEFHDAEILSLSLSVGCAKPWIPGCESPFLDLKMRLFDWNGTTANTLVEMQFREIREIELSNFSFQNSVSEIAFEIESRQFPDGRGGLSAPFRVIGVEIVENCGLKGTFACKTVEVISVETRGEAGEGISG